MKKIIAHIIGFLCLYAPIQEAFAQIEEILVTSRRYEESITDAPLAVAVMGAQELKENRIDSIQDILEITPGATWGQFAKAQPALTLRGIPGANFGNASLESSVSVVADGVPLTKAFMMTLPVYDQERVEILRGPQGTTFGRNATLGMMHFISAKPSQDFDAAIEASAGSLDLRGINGFVNGALSDTVSGRLAFNYQDTDGAMEDRNTGEALESSENLSLRASLMIEPSDTFSAYLKAEFIHDDELPTVRRGVSCEVPWLNATRFGGYEDDCDPWKADIDDSREWFVERDIIILSAELSWALNDDISITSITGYQDGEHDSAQDAFGTPFALRDQLVSNDADVFSQEVRIDNFASGNQFRWLLGAQYVEDEEFREELNIGFPERGNCGGQAAVGFDCAEFQLFTEADVTTESYGIFGSVEYDISDQFTLSVGGRYSNDSRDLDFATFGWGDAGSLAGLGLGNGARDCNANTVVDMNIITSPAGTFETVCGSPTNTMGFEGSVSDTWDNFSSKVSLSYQLNENNNLYLLYSEGFKSGGFQQDARAIGNLQLIVDSEEARNYELGWKGAYDRLVFAVTLFQQEQTNAQVGNNVPIGVGAGNLNLLTNTGGIENTGLEIEATWAPTDNLTIGGSFATYDPEFLSGSFQGGVFDPVTATSTGEDISNTVPANSVEETFYLFGSYNWELSDGSSLTFRADWNHRDSVFAQNGERNRAGLTLDGENLQFLRPELDKIGVNLAWVSADEHWNASIWGRNLDDDPDYINFGPGIGFIFNSGQSTDPNLLGVPSRPAGTTGRRQVGATLGYNF